MNVFVEPLVYAIVKKRPQNPVGFAIKWLQEYAKKKVEENSDSDSEEDLDEVAKVD